MQLIQGFLYYLLSLFYLMLPWNTYYEGMVGQPGNFLPSKASSEIDKTFSRLLYRGLFKYDNFGTLVPDLAETWEVSNEGLTYTVTIKDSQYWSDGSKINANDLLYTSYKIQNLSGVATDRIDDRTVRYSLPNKFSPFLSLLTVGVMQNGSEEKYQDNTAPTSGPFRIASVKKKGDLVRRIVLFNTEAKNIKLIAFRFYPNEEELLTGYKLGEVHAFLLKNQLDLSSLGLTRKLYPIQSVYYALFFNLRNKTYEDTALREKLLKTLNVEEIIYGHGIPVEGPVSRSYYTSEKYRTTDYDKLAAYDLGGQKITIDVAATPALMDIANKIKINWEDKLGSDVDILKHPSEEIRTSVIDTRNFEILLFGQEVGRDPDRYVNWHSTQAEAPGLNLSGFSSVRADRALEEGRKALETEERAKHYNEFQKVVDELKPAIFLHHPYMNYYVSTKIKGMGDKYTFTHADRFLDFNNWSF